MRASHAALALIVALAFSAPSLGQPAARLSTTVDALSRYPLFFHGRQVVVRGAVQHPSPAVVSFRAAETEKPVYLLSRDPIDDGPAEMRGEYWDLGRLKEDDARLTGYEVAGLLERVNEGRWPAQNQVGVIIVAQAQAPEALPPGLRAIALEPSKFEGKSVTVTGRFRGANLFGDTPQSPGKSKWEFVLQSADAAVWVTGLRPRGKGFDLDPSLRLDTGRSLDVTGIVHSDRGLVWIEAQQIALAAAPAPGPVVVEMPAIGPPPEIGFSVPTSGETDVSPSVHVRVQFTRDMKGDTFKDRVRVSYVGGGDAAPPPAKVQYHPENRLVEIDFAAPLERFRTAKIEFLDGITATDGAPLAPTSITFTLGGG